MKKNLTIEHTIMTLIFSYPIFMLLFKGWLSGVFILLCIFSGVLLIRKNNDTFLSGFDKTSRLILLAMASTLIATIFSQLYNHSFHIADWDSPSRFLLATIIFFALRSHSVVLVKPLQYGLPIGAITGLLVAVYAWQTKSSPFGERITNAYLNPIHFGDLALMLGLLSIASINWFGTDSNRLRLLKLCGLLAGVLTSALSGTRGGWIAIPVVLMALVTVDNNINRKKIIYGLLLLTIASVLGYLSSSSIRERYYDTYVEAISIAHGDFDTSLGSRMQIWKGAVRIFNEHPVFGVGADGFTVAITALGDLGYISKPGASEGKNEVHNQFFSSLAKLGLFGLLSYLLVHLVPLVLFIKAIKSRLIVVKKAAFMGVILIVGFMTFGLTVEMYNLKMVATFYSLSVVVLLATCYNTRHLGALEQVFLNKAFHV